VIYGRLSVPTRSLLHCSKPTVPPENLFKPMLIRFVAPENALIVSTLVYFAGTRKELA
jgi:hypothetical protein